MPAQIIDPLLRLALWKSYKKVCFYCNEHIDWLNLEIDHIIPAYFREDNLKLKNFLIDNSIKEDFNLNAIYNLVPSHNKCNRTKSNKLFDKSTLLFYLARAEENVSKVETEIANQKKQNKSVGTLAHIENLIENNIVPLSEISILCQKLQIQNNRLKQEELATTKNQIQPFHIPRKFRLQHENIRNTASAYEAHNSLEKIMESHSKVVLLGEAGSGKSHSLLHLHYDLLNKEGFLIPIYKRLNFYVDEDLNNFLPAKWEYFSEERLVFILDGLDEIQPNQFYTATRKILSFVEAHPNASFLISCRTNFYTISKETGTLIGFTSCSLCDLTMEDVRKYARLHLEINVEHFITEALEKGYRDLLNKPFFLDALISYYKENNNSVGTRKAVFEKFISSRLSLDINHYINTIELESTEKRLLCLCEKIGLIMEILSRNYLELGELYEIVTSKEDQSLIRFSGIFKKSPDDSKRWHFIHNNIQEYFAAKSLSLKSFIEFKNLVTYELDREFIRPSWYNTISFFVSICEEQKLYEDVITWLFKIETGVLIKLEYSRFENTFRLKVVRKLFEDAKNLDLPLRSNYFNEEDLAKFGDVSIIHEYLINELLLENTDQVKLNALSIIAHCEFDKMELVTLKKILIKYLNDYSENYWFLFELFGVLTKHFSHDKDFITDIINRFSTISNPYVTAGLYLMIDKSNASDKFIEVLIKGLSIGKNGLNESKRENFLDEKINLHRAILCVKREDNLLKLLETFNVREEASSIEFADGQLLEKLLNLCAQLFPNSKLIYGEAKNLLIGYSKALWGTTLDTLGNYFKLTNRLEQLFLEIWDENNMPLYQKGFLLAMCFTSKSSDYLLDKNCKLDTSKEKIIDFLYALKIHESRFKNTDQIKIFEQQVEIQFKLRLADYVNLNQTFSTQFLDNFNLLFYEEIFREKVIEYFRYRSIDRFTFHSIWTYRLNYKTQELFYYTESVSDYLQKFHHGKAEVTLEEVLDHLTNPARLSKYLISEIFRKVSNTNLLPISDEQRRILQSWCVSDTVLFKIRETSQKLLNSEEVNSIPDFFSIFWYFVNTFQFVLPEDLILDLTLLVELVRINNEDEIKSLEKFTTKEKIIDRVRSNLSTSIGNSISWKSNAEYAIKNGLTDCYRGILDRYFDKALDFNAKAEVLKTYLKITNDCEEVCRILSKTIKYQEIWFLTDLLMNNPGLDKVSKEELTTILLKLFEEANEGSIEKLHLSIYLTNLGNAKAWDYYCLNLIKNFETEGYSWNFSNFFISSISFPSAIPGLIKLLNIAKINRFSSEVYERLEDHVMNAFFNIGMTSKENFSLVKNNLRTFIDTHQNIPNINMMEKYLERLAHEFCIRVNPQYSLGEAIKITSC